ncbi:MAG: hypothetical protein PHY48_11660 [Candidatus Cloacimonetes bacterium]|jgi:glutathione synthase/RimK-type ligase-like ATP-grasp enzyme|nr:hypothetical protein [Candidatus Cloacimonadota bacterium]
MKALILSNEHENDHEGWLNACSLSKTKIQYDCVDLTKLDWMEKILQFNPNVCLLKPSGFTSEYRTLYQERIEVICRDLGLDVFPNYDELRIYENKRYFSYWAKANDIPHPQTMVSYHKSEALEKALLFGFPLVAKMNIGASGSGVRIIRDQKGLVHYIDQAFGKGITSKTGPNLKKGNRTKRIIRKLLHPKELRERLKVYNAISKDKQIGFVVLQEFIEHEYEWRVVRVGDSFFAHKKLKVGDKASGTLLKNYDNPPPQLLDFVKELTDRHGFRSVAVDIFMNTDNCYLVNEIQCIFGQSDAYQMKVDGVIGRYLYSNNNWAFEQGDFARNGCYDLRLDYVIRTHNQA